MSRTPPRAMLLPLLLPLTLVASTVGAFFLLHEPVEKEVPTDATGLAASNPWYATELLLGRLGVPTQTRYGLGELPPAGHVILLRTTADDQRTPLAPRLEPWVARGGHLILSPTGAGRFGLLAGLIEASDGEGGADDAGGADTGSRVADGPAEAMAPAGAKNRAPDPVPSDTGAPPGDDGDANEDEEPEDGLLEAFGLGVLDRWAARPQEVSVDVPGRAAPRTLQVGGVPSGVSWSLGDSDDPTTALPPLEVWPARADARARPGNALASRPYGDGRVSLVADLGILDNASLADLDHAPFLVDVLTIDGPLPDGALLVLFGDTPSITALIWRAAWPLVVALAVLLAAWGWQQSVRFGPPLPAQGARRRSLLEHIDATGHFLWRHGQSASLVEGLRDRVEARLQRRRPTLARLEGAERLDALADQLGVGAADARRAFMDLEPGDRRGFIDTIAALSRIWRKA